MDSRWTSPRRIRPKFRDRLLAAVSGHSLPLHLLPRLSRQFLPSPRRRVGNDLLLEARTVCQTADRSCFGIWWIGVSQGLSLHARSARNRRTHQAVRSTAPTSPTIAIEVPREVSRAERVPGGSIPTATRWMRTHTRIAIQPLFGVAMRLVCRDAALLHESVARWLGWLVTAAHVPCGWASQRPRSVSSYRRATAATRDGETRGGAESDLPKSLLERSILAICREMHAGPPRDVNVARLSDRTAAARVRAWCGRCGSMTSQRALRPQASQRRTSDSYDVAGCS